MQLSICTVVLLTLSEAFAGVSANKCPDGWVNWTNFCYKFSSEVATFENASKSCETKSAFLVSIHSLGEYVFVKSQTTTFDHWLGMRRNTTTQGLVAFKRTDWHWQDGTRYDWYNWVGNEPDTNAPCAKITQTGVWDDEYCSQRHKFACKIALQQPTTTASTTTTTSLELSATTTKANTVPNSSALTNTVSGSRVHFTNILTTTSADITSMTTSPSQTDGTTQPEDDFSVSSDPPQKVLLRSTPRQDPQNGKRKPDAGLYVGVAAGCVVVTLAVVTIGVVLYRRKRQRAQESGWMSKSYVASDADYVYARNDTPDDVDNISRSPNNRSHSPRETVEMCDTNASSTKSNGQSTSAVTDNTCQDIGDMNAVQLKKSKKNTHTMQTPETSPNDETEVDHVENDLCHGAGDTSEEFVDSMYIVQNDLYD